MTNLERIRKAMRLTQEALAKQAGVSDFTVRKLERGAPPTLTVAQKIAKVFDMPIYKLFESVCETTHTMRFDYRELLALIYGKFDSLAEFGQAIDLTEKVVREKMFGKRSWSQEQILTICDLLEIRYTDIPKYFFTFI